MGQLAFDLGHRPAFGREDFLVASGSRDAVGWIDRWPNWPGHALALYGPPGCGKTHLAHVFALRAGAPIVAGAALEENAVAQLVEDNAALVLEDGDGVRGERALLHLFNAVREKGGHLLLTGREPPARWPFKLADLTSRLAAVPSVRIAPPDDAMMEAVLVKLFTDRQLAVDPDVVGYLVRRIDRSFAAAREIVARADTASLAGKRAITVPLLREVLES
jgi:chromosomal replication initiation ATPase DnaA